MQKRNLCKRYYDRSYSAFGKIETEIWKSKSKLIDLVVKILQNQFNVQFGTQGSAVTEDMEPMEI